ncbi:MAG: hypothetical protein ACI4IK_01890 [Eubacterium sp.]
MKTCNKCNSIEQDSAKFCSNCGSQDFNFNYVINNNDIRYDSFEDENDIKKTRKKKMLSMLGVLALILLIIIGIAVVKITHDASKNENNTSASGNFEVICGDIDDGIYQNNWADIKFSMSSEWTEGSKKQYDSYEDKITRCDFYANNNDGESMVVLISDLSSPEMLSYSEEQLNREMANGIASSMQSASATEPTYAMVSNQLYMYSDITGQIDNKNVCISTFVRKIEEKAVIINITSNSVEKNHEIIDSIESCD